MELYPNTTQVPNVILNNLEEFNQSELKILLLITRKTIGWHKETDWLTYNYIESNTGLSEHSIRDALIKLIKEGWIKRIDEAGNDLPLKVTKDTRIKIFYTLSKRIQDHCKNYSGTTAKTTVYKTNTYKIENKKKDNKINDPSFLYDQELRNKVEVKRQTEKLWEELQAMKSAPADGKGYKYFQNKLRELKHETSKGGKPRPQKKKTNEKTRPMGV
jgi:phage replication O-like protein O